MPDAAAPEPTTAAAAVPAPADAAAPTPAAAVDASAAAPAATAAVTPAVAATRQNEQPAERPAGPPVCPAAEAHKQHLLEQRDRNAHVIKAIIQDAVQHMPPSQASHGESKAVAQAKAVVHHCTGGGLFAGLISACRHIPQQDDLTSITRATFAAAQQTLQQHQQHPLQQQQQFQ